ncbi:DUF3597 domain-containing protein [Chelativorans sp. AA-79]|uniref:DUF3597 domain-containing protein n=1 Tax=Chelativorans sp. AA-79 TaxID=3028735 RepID=UPI0023F89916|nr:DUF3597 domain-containing protein [Chelativorans sp. AA-79]WEX07498.1 DUF3597 domain-containing protein [Chelativorans sp. AA-79]
MSIFERIRSAIFNNPAAPRPAPMHFEATGSVVREPDEAPSAPPARPLVIAGTSTASRLPAPARSALDLETVLDKRMKATGQKLDWRTSIIGLMKALGLGTGLDARRKLARKLNYTGDLEDRAAVNRWLRAEIMKKLAANGGKVPD